MEGVTAAQRAGGRGVHDLVGQVQQPQRPGGRSGGGCGWWEAAPGQRDGPGAQREPRGAAEEAQLAGGRGVQAVKR